MKVIKTLTSFKDMYNSTSYTDFSTTSFLILQVELGEVAGSKTLSELYIHTSYICVFRALEF